MNDKNEVQTQAVYNTLSQVREQSLVGYEEGEGHAFVASQHQRILDAKGMDGTAAMAESTERLNRAMLQAQLSLDTADLLNSTSQAYLDHSARMNVENKMIDLSLITSSRMQEQRAKAQQFPLQAAAVGMVEATAPVDTPEPIRNVYAMQEYQLSTVAKYVENKKWIFAKDSWGVNVGALFVNPVRTIYGQGTAGTLLEGGKTGYFKFVTEWNKLPLAQQQVVWDEVVKRLHEASGGNGFVFYSLAYPLIFPHEEKMPYIDAAFDVIDFGITVGIWKIWKVLRTKMSVRSRVLNMGNPEAAGKATADGIKAGDVDAIADGGLIAHPHDPNQGKLALPTQLHIKNDLVAAGKLNPEDEIVAQAPALLGREIPAAVESRRVSLEATGAKVISSDIGPKGVEFTYATVKAGPSVTVTDLARAHKTVESRLAAAMNERKLLIQGSNPGENAEEVKALTNRIDMLKAHEEKILEAVSKGETTAKLDGPTSPITRKVYMPFTVDDVGKLEFKDIVVGLYTHFLGTPESRIGKLMDGLVSQGTFMRQQQRRLFGYFDKDVKELRKVLSKVDQEVIDKLNLTGDRLQTVFKDDALLNVGVNIDGLGHMRLSPLQVDAYHKMRRMYNDLYILADRLQVDELIFGGYEMFSAKLLGSDGNPIKDVRIFGKTSDIQFSPPVARRRGEDYQVKAALDLRATAVNKGAPVKLDTITDLNKGLTEKRYGFVKLRSEFAHGDDVKYTHAIVDVDHSVGVPRARGAHTPDHVLDYRVGYVPKLAQEQIRFIVETPAVTKVDGVEIKDTRIVRGFETEAEADIFINSQRAEGKGADLYKTEVDANFRRDVSNKEKVDFIDNTHFSGAFTGHRHDNAKFRIGLDGNEATRMSSFDALQRYADYIAAYMPMHEYKQAMIKRFLNSAKHRLADKSKWDSELTGAGDEWSELKAMQDWMKSVFAVPTTEEHVFAKFTDKMLGFLEKAIYNIPEGKQRKGTDTLKAIHHWAATSRAADDPVSFMKGVTFDLMLGTFNVAQLFVQSAGMFIPTTLHPIEAAKAMPMFLYARAAMHMGDVNAAAKASKGFGHNPREMRTFLQAWHKSGVPDSILENADFGHYAGNHGAYYSHSLVNTIRDKSRLFYNHGELNNRMFSFIMAFNRKASEKGWDLTKPLSDMQIQEVVQEALRLGTNMTAGNKAKWQDGILGLPTQFWQQTHKYYENLVYGLASDGTRKKLGMYKENQWTQAESATALVTNLLMFGAAGFGLDEWFKSLDTYLLDEKEGLGLDPEKDAASIALLRGGFFEMMSGNLLGFEVDMADRMGPASGSSIPYEKIWKPMATAGAEGKLGEQFIASLLGPTNTTLTRGLEAGKRFVTLIASDARYMTWDLNTVLATAMELASPLTSVTQLERALQWKAANDILNKRNIPLFIVQDGTEIPTSLVVIKAFGFDPLAKEKMEKLLRDKTMRDKDKASLARNIADDYRRMIVTKHLASKPQIEAASRRIALRKEALAEQFGQATADSVMASVMDLLNKEMSQYGMTDFQKSLFDAVFEATPESKLEQELKLQLELTNTSATIKGKPQDAR